MKRNMAVVGMGYWGRNLVRNFHELGALRVICDENPDVRELCREQYPEATFYADYAGVLQDKAIKAVVLATPAISHFDMAKRALEAGKDVFVEKPMAIHLAEGERLVSLAAEHKRLLMVGHILRYHPAVLRLQELIKEGELGCLQYVYSNRLNIGKIRTEENILWSFAPHDISVILGLLGAEPVRVSCQGGAYLSRHVFDVTTSELLFADGVGAHVFVSWLHPFKEQRLVVVGSEKMAVFDDTAELKLALYPHRVQWKNRMPTAVKAEAEPVAIESVEPLRAECAAFVAAIETRTPPATDGLEGLRVLRVLDACQKSLAGHGEPIALAAPASAGKPYFVHDTARVEEGAEIGEGALIWHYSHVMKGARIGARCVLGQNVNVDGGTTIGNNVKIQNNVSVYTGAVIEDDVFLGPSCVMTNVANPRSQVVRRGLYEKTVFQRGCSIGANATILCGITIGRYAFIAAGAVVTKDVPDYALMVGNPARQTGWMSRHGHKLDNPDTEGVMVCPESGLRYKEVSRGVMQCLDLAEEAPLPEGMTRGARTYREMKGGGREKG